MLGVLEVEGLVSHQRQDPPRGAHHDVGTAAPLEDLLVLLDADPAKEDGCADVVKVLAEPLILLVDLEGQLPVFTVCTRMNQYGLAESAITHLLMKIIHLKNALSLAAYTEKLLQCQTVSTAHCQNMPNQQTLWPHLVWHMTMTLTCPSTGSSCCRVAITKTAVLPMPLLAWQMTSMPRIA